MAITIKSCKKTTELHCQYSSQTSAQTCYVELDLAAHTLHASYDAEIGNAVPLSVWHGHDRRYPIPCLTADAANKLMGEILPLAERVLAGYESIWDGNNNVARLSDDADEAEREINALCEHDRFDEHEQVQAWDAGDWFADGTPDANGDITHETTDEQITAIAKKLEAELDSNVVVRGIENYLTRLRDEMVAVE